MHYTFATPWRKLRKQLKTQSHFKRTFSGDSLSNDYNQYIQSNCSCRNTEIQLNTPNVMHTNLAVMQAIRAKNDL